MPITFQYATKTGGLKSFEAENEQDALSKVGGFSDADPRSGVIKLPIGGGAPGGTDGGGSKLDDIIGGSSVRRYGTTSSGVGKNSTTADVEKYYGGLDLSPVDEDRIRDDMYKRVQARIDAVNRSFDAIIAEDKRQGEIALGQTRSTAARSGTLGSDFGNAALQNTQERTSQIIAQTEAQRANKINEILGYADERAEKKISEEKTRLKENQKEFIAYKVQVAESAREDVANLAKLGVSYDTLDEDRKRKLLDQTGLTEDQLKAQFVLNKPAADVLYKEVVGSTYVQISRDPITGKISSENFDLGFTVPKGYDSVNLGQGRVIFTPKDWDGDPLKIVSYVAAPAPGSGPGYKIPTAAKNDLYKAGFDPVSVDYLESDIREHGLGAVMEDIEDPEARRRVQEILDKDYQFI